MKETQKNKRKKRRTYKSNKKTIGGEGNAPKLVSIDFSGITKTFTKLSCVIEDYLDITPCVKKGKETSLYYLLDQTIGIRSSDENLFLFPKIDESSDKILIDFTKDMCLAHINPKLVIAMEQGLDIYICLLSSDSHTGLAIIFITLEKELICITFGVNTYKDEYSDDTKVGIMSPESLLKSSPFGIISFKRFTQQNFDMIQALCKSSYKIKNKIDSTFMLTDLPYHWISFTGYNCHTLAVAIYGGESYFNEHGTLNTHLFQSHTISPNSRFLRCIEPAKYFIILALNNRCCKLKSVEEIKQFLRNLIKPIKPIDSSLKREIPKKTEQVIETVAQEIHHLFPLLPQRKKHSSSRLFTPY